MKANKGRPGKAPAKLLTPDQFTVLLARAGSTKSEVSAALRAHLVGGETLSRASARWGVNRSNLYDKLKQMGLR